MLQCEWPKVWSIESREAVRVAIETAIRKAMAGSTNSQIRGVVNVDLPHLGASPPELVLSGIRELSVERTAVMVKLRYSGDFSVTLRGLQINLDTIGSSGEEADANLALPFYCPFEMTLHDILIDGLASVELLQEVEETGSVEGSEVEGGGLGGLGGSSLAERAPSTRYVNASSAANAQLLQAGRPPVAGNRPPGAGFSSGYGVLLGAGGRRAMRPPEALVNDSTGAGPYAASFSSSATAQQGSSNAAGASVGGAAAAVEARGMASANSAVPTGAGHIPGSRREDSLESTTTDSGRPSQGGERYSITDLMTKRATVKHRVVKIQLFGDPIKNLSVASNFASVPGANSKVEGTIKMLIKPSIDRMMTDGITIRF